MSDDEIKNASIPASSSEAMPKRRIIRKGSSGEHPVMQAVRKKLDSIREGTLPELEALNRRIDKINKVRSDPPEGEEKKEEEDKQGDKP